MVPPRGSLSLTRRTGLARGDSRRSRDERGRQRRAVRRGRGLERAGLDEVDPEPPRDRLGAGRAAERADARVLGAQAVAVGLDAAPDGDDALDPLELAVVRLRAR